MGTEEEKDVDKRQETEEEKLIAEAAEEGPGTQESEQTSEGQGTDIQPVQSGNLSEEQVESQMERQDEEEGNNAGEESGEAGDEVKEEIAEVMRNAGPQRREEENEEHADGRFDTLRELKELRGGGAGQDNGENGQSDRANMINKIDHLRKGDLYGAVLVAKQFSGSEKISNPFHSVFKTGAARFSAALDVSADVNSIIGGGASVAKPFVSSGTASDTVGWISTVSNAWGMITTFNNMCKKLHSLITEWKTPGKMKKGMKMLGIFGDILTIIAKGTSVAASAAKLLNVKKDWPTTVSKRIVPWLNAAAQVPGMLNMLVTLNSQRAKYFGMKKSLQISEGNSALPAENGEDAGQRAEEVSEIQKILIQKGKGTRETMKKWKRKNFVAEIEDLLQDDNAGLSEEEKVTLHQYLGTYYRRVKLGAEFGKNMVAFSTSLISLATNILTGSSNEVNIAKPDSGHAARMQKASNAFTVISGGAGAALGVLNVGKRGVDLTNQIRKKSSKTTNGLWDSVNKLTEEKHGLKGIRKDLEEDREGAMAQAAETEKKYQQLSDVMQAYDVPVASLMKVNTRKTFKKLLTAGID